MTDTDKKSGQDTLLKELTGVIHIHSSYSDGSKPVDEIAADASETGLDFIILTDHNTLKPKRDGFERFHQDVAVLIGYEINDKEDKNHYLALDIDKEVKHYGDPEKYINEVNNSGGFGIIAHPDEKEPTWKKLESYPWTRWDLSGYKLIEIWNQLSEWKEKLTRLNCVHHVLHPRKRLKGPLPETLQRWDSLNTDNKIFAIGGSDAHAIKYRFLKLFTITIYPYKVHFKSVRTHVLVPENNIPKNNEGFDYYKNNIYNALKNGLCYISNYKMGDARGFRFYANQNQKIFNMGSDIKLSDGKINLKVDSPLSGHIKLIHNSKTIFTNNGRNLDFPLNEPGVYRVEIDREEIPWIFTNPVWILK